MAEVPLHELELLRRSVAMLPPGAPNGLSREKALALITQLKDVTAERDRLAEAVREAGRAVAEGADELDGLIAERAQHDPDFPELVEEALRAREEGEAIAFLPTKPSAS